MGHVTSESCNEGEASARGEDVSFGGSARSQRPVVGVSPKARAALARSSRDGQFGLSVEFPRLSWWSAMGIDWKETRWLAPLIDGAAVLAIFMVA